MKTMNINKKNVTANPVIKAAGTVAKMTVSATIGCVAGAKVAQMVDTTLMKEICNSTVVEKGIFGRKIYTDLATGKKVSKKKIKTNVFTPAELACAVNGSGVIAGTVGTTTAAISGLTSYKIVNKLTTFKTPDVIEINDDLDDEDEEELVEEEEVEEVDSTNEVESA